MMSSIEDVFHWGCLTNAPSKLAYNARVKTKLMDYWEQKLRMEASTLDSILFFKPAYMSLRRPHPLWLQPISSIQCLYGCKDAFWQVSYWYAAETRTNNNSGRCLLSACKELFVPGSLEHILLFCPSLQPKRSSEPCNQNLWWAPCHRWHHQGNLLQPKLPPNHATPAWPLSYAHCHPSCSEFWRSDESPTSLFWKNLVLQYTHKGWDSLAF